MVAAATIVTDADARRRHHHRHYYFTSDEGFRSAARDYGRAESGLGALVPRGWNPAPREPDAQGSRFVSPRGDMSVNFFAVPASKDTVDQYWKTVALKEGEDLRMLQRDRGWVEVAAFKGGRRYVRKAVLACAEREWRHVEYELPADVERPLQAQVDRTLGAFDKAFTEFCDQTAGAGN